MIENVIQYLCKENLKNDNNKHWLWGFDKNTKSLLMVYLYLGIEIEGFIDYKKGGGGEV